MILGIPTKRDWKELKEMRQRKDELRDKIFQVILDGQNFLKEKGIISREDYWKWKLDFDLERYKN